MCWKWIFLSIECRKNKTTLTLTFSYYVHVCRYLVDFIIFLSTQIRAQNQIFNRLHRRMIYQVRIWPEVIKRIKMRGFLQTIISKCAQSYFELSFCGFVETNSKQTKKKKRNNNKINTTGLCQLQLPQTFNLCNIFRIFILHWNVTF